MAFDVHIKQLQNVDITLSDLKCKLNYKEEKPIYGQFKVISNNDIPKVSETTNTTIGKYKKEKNQTVFQWQNSSLATHSDDEDKNPTVTYQVSLETLKNSTIQIILKVDRNFASIIREQIIQKINIQSRFKSLHSKRENQNDLLKASLNLEENTARNIQRQTGELEDRLEKSF